MLASTVTLMLRDRAARRAPPCLRDRREEYQDRALSTAALELLRQGLRRLVVGPGARTRSAPCSSPPGRHGDAIRQARRDRGQRSFAAWHLMPLYSASDESLGAETVPVRPEDARRVVG